MPTNFLTEEQRKHFGDFTEEPDERQLAGSFLLDQTARRPVLLCPKPPERIPSPARPHSG